MKHMYKPAISSEYKNHYLYGGSDIGSFFNSNQYPRGAGLSGVLSSITRYLVPFIKKNAIPQIKKISKKALPMIQNEAKAILKTGAKELSNAIIKKQTPKQAIQNTKKFVKKRALDIIQDSLEGNPSKLRKTDIFDRMEDTR